MGAAWLGATLIVFGGALQGTFAVPMKYARLWKHENIWFVFALTGLVIFPWLITAATVPNLFEIFSAIPVKSLALIVLFGVGWGVGATLTGLALQLLGIGLGYAIVLGLSASVGSLIPLLVLTPEQIGTPQGHLYLLGTFVMLVGITVVSVAGSLRERSAQTPAATDDRPSEKTFAKGLIVGIAAGIFSSMLNFSYAFGSQAIEIARHSGASAVWAPNVVAAPATSGGFLANFLYCAYMMRRNNCAKLFWRAGAASHWVFGLMMGAFWFGGLIIYGIGVNRMGAFGAVVGWPLLMGAIILSSNIAGLAMREWSNSGARAKTYLFSGSVLIMLALLTLAMAQRT